MNKNKQALNRALSGLRPDPWLAERVLAKSKGEDVMKKRISISGILVVTLIVVMFSTALASSLYISGIIDFAGRGYGVYVPENASESISRDEKRIETNSLICTINETYYDGNLLRVAASVTAKDGSLLTSTDIMPYDRITDVIATFDAGGKTFGEYAAEAFDGKMAHVSLYVTDDTTEQIWNETHDCMLNRDGSIILYLECCFSEEKSSRDVHLNLTYIPSKADSSLTNNSKYIEYDYSMRESEEFELQVNSVEVKHYVSDDPMEFQSVGVRIDRAELTITPLEIRYALYYTVTDAEKYEQLEDGLWFEFIDPASREEEYSMQRISEGLIGAGSVEQTVNPDDNSVCLKQSGSIGLDSLSDSYTIRAFNAWDKTRYESVEFTVTEQK